MKISRKHLWYKNFGSLRALICGLLSIFVTTSFGEDVYSLDLEQCHLYSALSNLTEQAGIELHIKSGYQPSAPVTCRFFDKPLDESISILLQGLSYSCLYDQSTNGTITGLTLFIEGPDGSKPTPCPASPYPQRPVSNYTPDNFIPIPQHLKDTAPPHDSEEAINPPPAKPLSPEQLKAHYAPISPRLQNDPPP